MFEVHVLGVGDAFSELLLPASLVLEHDGERLGVDCPDRYRAVLRAACARSGRDLCVENIDRMVITHLHGDHAGGLEGVGFYKHFVESQRLEVFASAEVCDRFWERLRVSMGTVWDGRQHRPTTCEDFFTLHRLAWQEPNDIGPFRLTLRRTVHHLPTSALLVRAGDRTFGYSADTAFDAGLIEFLGEADLIFHEVGEGAAHSAAADLAALPAALRERMRLIHYPDGFDTDTVGITALETGEVLRV